MTEVAQSFFSALVLLLGCYVFSCIGTLNIKQLHLSLTIFLLGVLAECAYSFGLRCLQYNESTTVIGKLFYNGTNAPVFYPIIILAVVLFLSPAKKKNELNNDQAKKDIKKVN